MGNPLIPTLFRRGLPLPAAGEGGVRGGANRAAKLSYYSFGLNFSDTEFMQ